MQKRKCYQPVISGATGTIEILFGKCLSNLPGKYNFKELQKTVILGTGHLYTSGSTFVKVQNFYRRI